MDMIKNYFTVAIRNLIRNKAYAVINISGLALGMACSLLVFLFVWHELNYDTYHTDHERIFRISTDSGTEADPSGIAGCSENVTPYLIEHFPEVEQIFRIQSERPRTVRVGEQAIQVENIKYADNDLLALFHMPVIHGSSQNALDRPNTAVLTRSISEQLFGAENPVGKTIQVDTTRYQITAVVANSPTNTHLKFGIIASWSSQGEEEWRHQWDGGFYKTYVKLAEGTDPVEFEDRIKMLVHEQAGEGLRQAGRQAILFLQPVADIHLNSNLLWEAETPGNVNTIYIFGVVGLIVLIIACMNFMNLSTARSAGRAAEVGMRKVAGALRMQLVTQFLGETFLTSVVALALSLVLVDLALPAFNELAGTGFVLADLLAPAVLALMSSMVLFVGGVAGLYPALVLSSFRPAQMLKQSATGRFGSNSFRRTLVAIQFTLAVVMIVGTITVYHQIDFMSNRPLGFDRHQKLILEMPSDAVTYANYESIKHEFLSHSAVLGATFSTSVPGRWNYQWRTYPTGESETNTHTINWYGVDRDFVSQYELELVAGDSFGPDCQGAMCEGILLNEAAVRTFAWSGTDQAPGKTLFAENRPVVGVVRDFHLKGLQAAIEPMGLFIMGDDFRYLTLSVAVDDLSETMALVRDKYSQLLPGELLNTFFLDQDFDRQYRAERKLGTVFGVFAALGVVIAALGLFGMASYSAQSRRKEIGVRKVLGASVRSVIGLLTKEVMILIAIANAVAWPVAYLATSRWFETFAYRTSVGWTTFVLAATLSAIMALVSVGYQSLRAARANPVESLKCE